MKVTLKIKWEMRLKLHAEGDRLWAEAIIETHGNITPQWIEKKGRMDCELKTGEYFSGDALKDVAELA